jgi:hypothetical protein
MRIVSVIVSSAIVGTVVGSAIAYIDVRPGAAGPPVARPTQSLPPPGASEPRVSVDRAEFDFGTMQRGTSMSHGFVFRNIGHGPLTLRVGNTSCKCTLGSVPEDPIPPGGEVSVTLEWTAKINAGPFRQTATVQTNDPNKPRVELQVDGKVIEATGVTPSSFIFDKVMADESKSAEIYVMAMAQDTIEVGTPVLSTAETREFFDVRVDPVERSALPNPDAKQGVKVTVTAKPGLPLGRFDQWLRLSTNIKDAKTLELPIVGRVVGNISVHGRLWSEEQGVLRLGTVSSEKGTSAELNIVIRGDGADATELSVVASDPKELIAKLGERKVLSPTLVHVPLVVEIPPGTPPMAHLDTEQGEAGKIMLKTTSKEAAQMVLHVRFAVER